MLFFLRRLVQSIPLIILISMLIFWLLQSAPGGPLTPYLQNPHITQADIERLKHNFGLDQPLPFRYLAWLNQVVHGDFRIFDVKLGTRVASDPRALAGYP